MGKQKGDGARSKARPSSSSQAASLLPTGATTVGFGGYVGGTRVDSTLRGDEPVSLTEIDGEIAQHLKRLARKDPITKLKALSSLSTLLQQRSGKDIIPIIPQWVFEYKRLLMDYNREVRRSTHETMISLVNVVGRGLAPHLKSLMGPWWFSQFDSLSEVSQAAKQSFQVAFPTSEKRLDALMFCTGEIFIYLGDNLKLTPQSMSDLAAAADELPETDSNPVETKHVSKARSIAISSAGELFSAHKCFLGFLSSPSPAIRSAVYSVLRSFIKRAPQVLCESDIKNLSSAIYGSFQEKDPSCHAPMWETIVLFSKQFPASWSYINFQKIMLNRFWQFLRNGCYGSQQVSYPVLVLFLDILPLEAIAGEKFFLDFFQNLWAGRSSYHPSNTDRKAFFLAFKECFIWALRIAMRICNGQDAAYYFQMSLIKNVLVKILWLDYLNYIGSKHGDKAVSLGSEDSIKDSNQLSGRNVLELKSSEGYMQHLGQCMVEILTSMHHLDHQLLSPFTEAFQNTCLEFCQETDHVDTSSDISVQEVITFLFLLDQYAVRRAETWPWDYLVGPLLDKSFSLISSNDLSAAIQFLTVVVNIFGPHKVILRVGIHNERFGIGAVTDLDKEAKLKYFLQEFKGTFVSWCLGGNDNSAEALLDLLLALLEDECFTEQWNIIVSYVTHEGHFEDMSTSDLTKLTILMEKAQMMIVKRRTVFEPIRWHHELLDSAAISIIHSTSCGSHAARFIRAILGASSGDNRVLFVSKDAETQIYREALKKLLYFVIDSPYAWVQSFASLLSDRANISLLEVTSSVLVSKMAHFAVEVLDGCYFYGDLHSQGCELISSVIAAVFIVDWECNMTTSLSDTHDKSLAGKLIARKEFSKVLHDFRAKMSVEFFRTLNAQSKRRLGDILVQFIRSIIFDGCSGTSGNSEMIASLCCQWIIEVVQYLCCDEIKEQYVLDLLFRSNDLWPLWIRPDSSFCGRLNVLQPENVFSKVQIYQGQIFAALIDKLMSRIGIQKVIVGCPVQGSATDEKEENEFGNPASTFGRFWLATEMLCTWKWPGGSAISTFLPLLSSYAKENSHKNSSFHSIVNILFDGALIYGETNKLWFFESWHPSTAELDAIKEPFLRALVCLLLMLFDDGVWAKENAHEFFKLLIDKLYIGEAANMICLKILPAIVHVLARQLQQAGSLSSKDSQPDVFNPLEERLVDDWLPRALKFPCLISWKPGEDIEEWLQLVLSCYPISITENLGVVKLDRVLSLSEKRLLLQLFRKQQFNSSLKLGVTTEIQVAQVLVSRLVMVAVGYCWEEFEDDDWLFVLSQLKCWMEAVILPLEEAIEGLDHAAQNAVLDRSKPAVDSILPILALDTCKLYTATNALYAYSLISSLVQCPEPAKEEKLLFLRTENCQHSVDQIEEGILRMFFSNGVAESIYKLLSDGGSSIMSDIHNAHPFFWKMVASVVVKSSVVAREEAVKSVELWGLSRDPISSLLAILLSSTSATCLRLASFELLSNAPIASRAILMESATCHVNETSPDLELPQNPDLSSEGNIILREEISCMIENLPAEILDMDLEAEERVKVFLSWSLLLSHLVSLPSSSPERERLVQHILDSASSVILRYLFQHIPLDLAMTHCFKKRDAELPSELSDIAVAAKQAITTGSVAFAIESLWPIFPQKLAVLASAIFSLMLRLLPAYVRDWFGGLRDRSMSTAIECFTKAWCSPYLIADELSQIKRLEFADDNFSVSVSKSANEVVATYTKDETGMDLVIRLPASYPLRVVDVECTRSLGISEVKQRKWLLSMVSFVRNQNGALAEAIQIWKSNFDKEFEGIEECPICYSVIHTTNHSLPRLACRTCRHKFHSACLYKWFSTSHKSTCPLCQSPF
ncbi:hypothetical protein V2J09_019030 [Rumex salicifolius]